ncbi:MAG: formate dehydrogenase subunit delta [Alphaproteobacteria bacterium]|nr:formate dehydrogenase subunit delta [Alphaproteobacteria bacterium]
MSPDKLVYMANQIAKFFAHEDEAQAVAAIADHLTAFWEPRMRAAILKHAASGGHGLDPRVRQALQHAAFRGGRANAERHGSP